MNISQVRVCLRQFGALIDARNDGVCTIKFDSEPRKAIAAINLKSRNFWKRTSDPRNGGWKRLMKIESFDDIRRAIIHILTFGV